MEQNMLFVIFEGFFEWKYIYIYIYFRIKNAINANCLIIDNPLLLCNKDSQGDIINI